MTTLPQDTKLDSTIAFAVDGYRFISKRCERYHTNVFQTRLLLQKTICMRGEAAAKIFYDMNRFDRRGAAPKRLQATLFGLGGVQGLDNAAHHRRKQMFLSLMSTDNIQQLSDLSVQEWRKYALKWKSQQQVVLLDEVREIFCRAVCVWAGVPLPDLEVKERADDFAAMIEGGGAVGIKHWRSRQARRKTEKWIAKLVRAARTGQLVAKEGSALQVVACHLDHNGKLLDARVAAVELINILRPTVAVAWYIVFVALALHEHPQCLQRLQDDEDGYLDLFVQEVRRFYPFFPVVAAKVRKDFQWNGYEFPKGIRVLLDLYGTNHDPAIWEKPDEFWPERFLKWNGSAFNFIPQGGGDHAANHRCPGEWITIELMKSATTFLAENLNYVVPDQDLRLNLSRMPATPNSHFVMNHVKPKFKNSMHE